jgi:hypothetical protein
MGSISILQVSGFVLYGARNDTLRTRRCSQCLSTLAPETSGRDWQRLHCLHAASQAAPCFVTVPPSKVGCKRKKAQE